MRPETFIEALGKLEQSGDLAAMTSLYSDDAELINPTLQQPLQGPQGAEQFWDSYRRTFDQIRSEFRAVTQSDGVIMLEWVSRGRLAGGREVRYEGVSVVEHRDGRVRRFQAYFDPATLSEQLQGSAE